MNQVHAAPVLLFVLAGGAVLLLLAAVLTTGARTAWAEAVLAFCLVTAAYAVRPRLRGKTYLPARSGGEVTRA